MNGTITSNTSLFSLHVFHQIVVLQLVKVKISPSKMEVCCHFPNFLASHKAGQKYKKNMVSSHWNLTSPKYENGMLHDLFHHPCSRIFIKKNGTFWSFPVQTASAHLVRTALPRRLSGHWRTGAARSAASATDPAARPGRSSGCGYRRLDRDGIKMYMCAIPRYVYVCMCIDIYMCVHVCMCIYMGVYIYICVCVISSTSSFSLWLQRDHFHVCFESLQAAMRDRT